MGEIRGLNWQGRSLLILDQTRLPLEEHYQECRVWPDVVEAIQGMRVRGAPAIGLAGAYAVALACLEYANLESVEFHSKLTALNINFLLNCQFILVILLRKSI